MTKKREYKLVVINKENGKSFTVPNMPKDKETLQEMADRMNSAEDSVLRAEVRLIMNKHEEVVARLIREEICEILGGYENSLMDFHEGEEEYEYAKRLLGDHERLVNMFYREIMEKTEGNFQSHIRFAGKEFILDRIEKALRKEGY